MASLDALASTITKESNRLAAYIHEHHLPNPSFDVNGPPIFPVPLEDADLQKSRMTLIRAAQDLATLALGPAESLRWQAWNQYNDNISLQAIMRYRIAESIPRGDSIAFADLASKVNLDEAFVTRILRHAMSYHVFSEPSPGYVSHTVSSTLLHSGGSVRDWLDMTLEEWGPASVKAIDALEKYRGSQEPKETGFGLAFNGQTIFEFLAQRPERARVFASAMGNFSKGISHKVEHLVENYCWADLGDGVVIDIGGSHGHISLAIARATPQLRFVVQDLPGVVADGERLLPSSFAERVSFQAHDMNDLQPVHGAALYLFRSVLLNWPDGYVVKFLRNLIPALKPGARVLINEGVLPQPGEVNPWDEKIIRSLDLCMMATFNSKERTVSEWDGLFQTADRRFRFLGAKRPSQGLLWIIEAVWEG